MDVQTAAALVLAQVHDGETPKGVSGLTRLAWATRVLRAAGVDPLDRLSLETSAKTGSKLVLTI